MLNRREFLLTLGLFAITLQAKETERVRCSICGMFIEEKSPIGFIGERDGKKIPFCSFTCAHAFHRKYPDSPLTTFDYHSREPISADKAFFLIRSEKLASEFKLAMPPVVVAFGTEPGAKLVKERVKEGEILAGFSAVAKVFGR